MLVVSQTVSIDSINQETRYDRKATIAVGNLIKQRDSLLNINQDQQRLIDSLRLESRSYKREGDTLRSAYSNLKFAYREKEAQLKATHDKFYYKEKLFESDLRDLKRKRLGLGLSIGYGLASEGQSPFAGVSINYTLFRF